MNGRSVRITGPSNNLPARMSRTITSSGASIGSHIGPQAVSKRPSVPSTTEGSSSRGAGYICRGARSNERFATERHCHVVMAVDPIAKTDDKDTSRPPSYYEQARRAISPLLAFESPPSSRSRLINRSSACTGLLGARGIDALVFRSETNSSSVSKISTPS